MKSRKVLAVAILTLNEELDLDACLLSVSQMDCDIYVFDSNSTDDTQKIAMERGATVVKFSWNGKYPKKKQWAINFLKDSYEWLLLLDADELLSPFLISEIQRIISKKDDIVAFDAKLEYWFLGQKLRFGLKAYKRILFQPSAVFFPEINDLEVSNMWEVEGHYQPKVLTGNVGKLKNALIHRDTGSLFDYISRHNRYSDWESYVNCNSELKALLADYQPKRTRIFSSLPLKGFFIFIYSYIYKLGFLDGRKGFDFAAHKAFYYWQIKAKTVESFEND